MPTIMSFWPQTLVDYAQIVGALATAAAVIVSLFIALRKPKPLLSVRCDIKVIIWGGQPADVRPEYVCIQATNVGSMSAIITGAGWMLNSGIRKKSFGIQDLSHQDHLMKNKLTPTTLAHGEEVNFYLPLQGHHHWLQSIEERGFFSELVTSRKALDRLYVLVFSTVGGNHAAKPSKGLLDRVWKAQQKYNSTAKNGSEQ